MREMINKATLREAVNYRLRQKDNQFKIARHTDGTAAPVEGIEQPKEAAAIFGFDMPYDHAVAISQVFRELSEVRHHLKNMSEKIEEIVAGEFFDRAALMQLSANMKEIRGNLNNG